MLRANCYQRFFQQHKQNMQKIWWIKAIINIRNVSEKSININCLNKSDIEETDSAILSNLFNKFFTIIAQKNTGK